MKFNIVVIDPPQYRYTHFLFNSVKYICYGLESLGHDCYIAKNNFDAGKINIIIGAHNITNRKIVSAILDAKIKYILRQSEIIRYKTINIMNNPEKFKRIYLPLMKNAISVWDGNAVNMDVLQELGIEAELFRLGYHSAMEEIPEKNTEDIDFLFFGSVTPHRKEMLDRLTGENFRTEIVFDPVSLYRNDLIARSKIILNIKQGDTMPHLPYARILYSANNKKLVISEDCEDQDWIKDIFLPVETSKFIDLCKETVVRKDRKELALSMYEKVKEKPITGYLEPILDKIKM